MRWFGKDCTLISWSSCPRLTRDPWRAGKAARDNSAWVGAGGAGEAGQSMEYYGGRIECPLYISAGVNILSICVPIPDPSSGQLRIFLMTVPSESPILFETF
jgi:hypothetical protein